MKRSCFLLIRKFSSNSSNETRLNPLNIQILGKSLTAKVFPNSLDDKMSLNRLQMQTLELSRAHLESHTIPWQKDRQLLPEISGNSVPNLLGNEGTLKDHFMRMAADLGEEYFKLALDFSKTLPASISKPPNKEEMEYLIGKSGWFKWNSSTKNWEKAEEGPIDKVIIFDIETCPQISQFPLLASAYGQSGWYIWIQTEEIYNSINQRSDLDRLISLKHPILVIGHNVAFDRARIREEYTLERGNRRFLDTLSMHCAVSGLSSQQRGLWLQRKKKISILETSDEIFEDSEEFQSESLEDQEMAETTEKWGSRSSLNNLADALQLHCNRKLDKSVRDDVLLKSTSSSDVYAILPEISAYCAKDVEATAQLFAVLFPKFLKKSPHPVTFSALLEMGSFVLPIVREDWQRYIRDCDALYDEATKSIEIELNEAVEETVIEGLKGKPVIVITILKIRLDIEKTLKDPWLCQLDWTVDPIRYTKARYLKDGVTFAKGGEPRQIGNTTWAGKPAWFKKLIKSGKVHVTPRTSIVPFLLKLKWKGGVIHLIPDFGWCFERDSNTLTDTKEEEIISFNGKKFQRIPHPGGRDENVGCLLTKSFLKYFQSGDLSTENKLIEKVLEVNSKFSFWTGYRERIREQFVVENGSTALILPTVQPMGTVTRRAVEKTWLTASNAKEKLVGSELKAMVKAPEGWCFVGADVDSQELWIGSLLGDAQFGWSGSTALGWMNLQGSKSDGTDLHSRTASILGMTRDNAKIFNYGRIYGAGVKYAAQLLLKFNPNLSPTEAAARASDLYHATKGRRIANRRDAFVSYAGGTESFMFNQMEAIAKSPVSRTPVLSAEISDGLISEHVDDNFITSRVNWVVQSSGVDYLHMLLVAVSYLFKHYKIPGRVALTIHDEVRFLVPEMEKYRAALALQIANLWTRAAFVEAVGVQDLPLSVAFFSAVDIDKVLRKEVHLSCITPSNKQPISPGQALDIYKLLQNCSSLGNCDQPNIGKLMYNYYVKNGINPISNENKAFNFEEEKKYLTVLKKQMKKSDDHSKERDDSQKRPQADNLREVKSNHEQINSVKIQKFEKKNEILNRWKILTSKQK